VRIWVGLARFREGEVTVGGCGGGDGRGEVEWAEEVRSGVEGRLSGSRSSSAETLVAKQEGWKTKTCVINRQDQRAWWLAQEAGDPWEAPSLENFLPLSNAYLCIWPAASSHRRACQHLCLASTEFYALIYLHLHHLQCPFQASNSPIYKDVPTHDKVDDVDKVNMTGCMDTLSPVDPLA
jgi:hypothetical protein